PERAVEGVRRDRAAAERAGPAEPIREGLRAAQGCHALRIGEQRRPRLRIVGRPVVCRASHFRARRWLRLPHSPPTAFTTGQSRLLCGTPVLCPLRLPAWRREILIGSPSLAFAFGIDASQVGANAPGPSQAARPPAELRQRALRWHPTCNQQG